MSVDLLHPRNARLMRETIALLRLDLTGLTILTEAATGPFAVTPSLALAAGADRVLARTRDSRYGSAFDAASQVRALARALGCDGSLEVVTEGNTSIVSEADVITNLGALRPIDAQFVSRLKRTAVIALMCESWEFRPGDLDREACLKAGIVVLGTNEHAPGFPVFSYCGPLALQMLLEAGYEVLGTRVALIGRDSFSRVIADFLARAGALVTTVDMLAADCILAAARQADVIFVAEYARDEPVLGSGGLVSAQALASVAPDATVIQLAGGVDEKELLEAGLRVWPSPVVPPRRMSRTLASLGARPVIELHAAGLLVGALGARARLSGAEPHGAVEWAVRHSPLVQPLVPSYP